MTDIRDELNLRRHEILSEIGDHYKRMGLSEPGSPAFERGRAIVEELRSIEAILAQMQNTDATQELARAQRDATEAQRAATAEAETTRATNDHRSFWQRRFITSLAVAHGAGAFAAVTALLRPEAPVATGLQLAVVLSSFFSGLVLMGGAPFFLSLDLVQEWSRKAVAVILTVTTMVATLLLFVGVWVVTMIALQTFTDSEGRGAVKMEVRLPRGVPVPKGAGEAPSGQQLLPGPAPRAR